MCSLQFSNCRGFDQSAFPSGFSSIEKKLRKSRVVIHSSFWGGCLDLNDGNAKEKKQRSSGGSSRVYAMSSTEFKMNLNEYMVTLDKPLGIRFALSLDGKVFVHALQKGGNAEKSRIIMVGDTLKKASESSGARLIEIKDFGDTENSAAVFSENSSYISIYFRCYNYMQESYKREIRFLQPCTERPFSPFPIHQLYLMNDLDILFNRGRVPIATWNKNICASNLRASSESSGNSGFAVFSPKFLTSQGWKHLNDQNVNNQPQTVKNTPALPFSPLIAVFTEEVSEDAEWAHGSFPLEEVPLKLNWGIDSNLINESCQKFNILMINYPIRDADSFDMRKKLPFCVGLLLRLLKKNYRVYVTCTNGFDRSPACVIAYLHWMTDTSLHAAYNFVTGLHSCRPDRPAIAWATWDLIAMVESGRHDGPSTHAVTFVWNGHEGEDVCLVGDFTGNWKEPIKAVHKGGPRYEVEVRLPQGKYYYKYITNGDWRHSTTSPTERDDRGNINNVIVIGDTASVKPSVQQPKKDANIVKVIERPLTENERFMLAKAARCVAFSVCPIRLAPK
ncbi:UNVERIFIED_CONTAM: Phosphoglucan phosphatase LSF1, chloroplastic [Sesamum radiatum]|uniref:Phosphoglucan phosphatase LSF1, chloroplastic n=1 Tax=Sesamum radiatum TaxID=300843 RepID=A0AAW2P886_SESRA